LKKIIFIHLLNDYSGSPKVLSQVINAVKKNGYDFELYTGKSDNGFLSGLTDKHQHYFYKRFDNKYLTLFTFMFSQVSVFLKLLKYHNEDVLIYVNTMLPFGAALAGKILNKPVYYHVHESFLQPPVFKQFLRFVIQKCSSQVIFVSKSVQQLEYFIDIPQKVIYNSLPEDLLEVANKSHYEFKKEGVFNVIMICSLKAYKGVCEFIEVASLCKYHDIEFTLVLNSEQVEINSFFKQIALPPNLTLMPKQQNVTPIYQSASLLLNLSRVDQWVETFGLTIIEAMAFGIPVIVPPVGGPMEIITGGEEGYLISSYMTDEIAKKIINLSEDAEMCTKLSKSARARALCFGEDVFENDVIKTLFCS
jgi:glycosyltransferase involved in cell wall biosynthesis